MRSSAVLLLALPLLGGGCATYSVRRAALVPHVAPVTTTGQPMSAPVDFSLGTSNALSLGEPSEGSGGGGIYIPRLDVNGGLRARIGNASLGLLLDFGSGEGATATASDMPHPEGDTYGGGLTFAYSLGEDPWRVGIEIDLLDYSIPWKETWTCVDHCQYGTMDPVYTGREDIAVLALGVVPSYRSDNWVFHGGLTLRNHPTIDKGDVTSFEIEEPVTGGPVVLVVSAGAEALLAPTVKAGVVLYTALGDDPVAYPLTLAAQLTVGIPGQ